MTIDQLLSEVWDAFGALPRPEMFIRGTCFCEECREHEAEMQSFDRINLPLEKLDNPGWDPFSFASSEAFFYFMPGCVKLALDHAYDYVEQFLFHLTQPERLVRLTPYQAQVLVHVLDYLILNESKALDENLAVEDIYGLKEKLLENRLFF